MEKQDLFTEEVEPPGSQAEEEKPPSVSATSREHISHFRSEAKTVVINPPRWAPRFVVSNRTREFKRRFFQDVTLSQWNDWRWQLANRLVTLEQVERILKLSALEKEAIVSKNGAVPLAITPYYASLLDPEDSDHPIRRTVIPTLHEYVASSEESGDPLNEEGDTKVPGIVHRYPDRVLFLVTDFCSTYCRYCTRSRLVGQRGKLPSAKDQWERALTYIREHRSVRDVLLSGGDALTLPDEALHWLLNRLREIPHVEFLRIGTKVPVVLPQRVTPSLTRVLKKFHPLWISVHFTHPDEITPETTQACERLADAGVPLGSQTVLLKGINDDIATMKRLFHGLLRIRVRPYYLYQCDPILGSAHFRTPVSKGIEIIEGLRGHTSGYAVPHFVIDAPGGGGKIPLLPNYVIGREGDHLFIRNYRGDVYRYPDPIPRPSEVKEENTNQG